MSDHIVEIECSTIAELDFEPPCDSRFHHSGRWGHVPDQAASWAMRCKCGDVELCCDGFVNLAHLANGVNCFICGDVDWAYLVVSPIGVTS